MRRSRVRFPQAAPGQKPRAEAQTFGVVPYVVRSTSPAQALLGHELIASGVDVRTVAGRLGHSGGGTTTLRVYSAWVAEADQRAAGSLAGRMPALPAALNTAGELSPSPTVVGDGSPIGGSPPISAGQSHVACSRRVTGFRPSPISASVTGCRSERRSVRSQSSGRRDSSRSAEDIGPWWPIPETIIRSPMSSGSTNLATPDLQCAPQR